MYRRSVFGLVARLVPDSGVNGRRVAGLALALLVELLLGLALLSLARPVSRTPTPELTVISLSAAPEPAEVSPEQQAAAPASPQAPQAPTPPTPAETPPAEPPPAPALPPLIDLSRDQMAAADIATLPDASPAKPAKRPVYGPAFVARSGDTPRVEGSGPNGEPLYAASWYREPYEDELKGYLSSASGPGWGLIACRTVPNFRVEDCVALAEYPEGSSIARAVLAAAWQFRVRPPQLGGQPKVGEWVRIRIDYGLRAR